MGCLGQEPLGSIPCLTCPCSSAHVWGHWDAGMLWDHPNDRQQGTWRGTSPSPGAIAQQAYVGARAHQLSGSNPDYSTSWKCCCLGQGDKAAQLDGGRDSGLHTQAKHSPTSPAGKRLHRREKALGNDGGLWWLHPCQSAEPAGSRSPPWGQAALCDS